MYSYIQQFHGHHMSTRLTRVTVVLFTKGTRIVVSKDKPSKLIKRSRTHTMSSKT